MLLFANEAFSAFSRHKFKLSIIGLICMTVWIGLRFLNLDSSAGSSNHNSVLHHKHKQRQIDEIIENVFHHEQNDQDLVGLLIQSENKKAKSNKPVDEPAVSLNNAASLNEAKQPTKEPRSASGLDFLQGLERIVHIDLKGAPPKPSYFAKFLPFIKQFGATGILLEYEDMFPYEGRLAEARNGHAYSAQDIGVIKQLAAQSGLSVMPLVQTYGHLEWLLKIKSFAHLRDAEQFPQVITPCLNESYTVIYDMLDQVIKQHDNVKYFHVGCDEVYYKLVHANCAKLGMLDFTSAFMNHLIKIATYIREKLPSAKIIFWDDMLHGMNEQTLDTFKDQIIKLEIEPMMWGYMEDVQSYFQPHIYEKHGRVFEKIWIATAYKGASGELAKITSIEHHYLNHLSWIDVMSDKIQRSVVQFKGVALTGWSRYDHFLTLCDLLPQAVPSLVFSLQAIQHGKLSAERRNAITSQLGCSSSVPWFGEEANSHVPKCTFPGHEVYEAMLSLGSLLADLKPNMDFANKYMTPMSLNYGYLHKQRSLEVHARLSNQYQSLVAFKNRFIQACDTMFYNDTAVEWLLVYFVPQFDQLYDTLSKMKQLSTQNDWKPRPLPVTLRQYPDSF